MAADYVPGADPAFNSWQSNFVTYANANLVALGLVAGDMTPVTTAQTAWNTAYTDNVAKQNAAQAARQLKDMKRAAYEGAIRPLVKRMQASTSVDDSEKAALGITVPDTIHTPTAVPTSKPVVQVECASRLEQSIAFADEGTPTKKAKPAGVLGAEIWVKILPAGTAPPTDPTGFEFLALDTSTPYVATFAGSDGGKTAHYILRWVNSKGDKGPWSATASATIMG